MNFNYKIVLLLAIAALTIIGVVYLQKNNNQNNIQCVMVSYLQQLEQDAWKKIGSIGLTKNECLEKIDELPPLPTIETQKLSPYFEKISQEVLNDFGVDKNEIFFTRTTKSAPAFTSGKTIHIHEEEMKTLSKQEQKFVIGHELHHIMNQDSDLHTVIQNEADIKKGNGSIDCPLNTHCRFCEFRADIETALKNNEYAQGYKEFIQHYLIDNGRYDSGITHPKHKDRLALAEKLCASLPQIA
ncbi:M48 family metalloprotease [Candidatus Dependentiae bacterium]|nr:M48 family metalloprotease [Candidatus Dependentiae bacterium]